jgi:Signal transduction histidine kinase
MKKLFCILFSLLPLFLQAQQTNIDSLLNVLSANNLKDSEKVLVYRKIAAFYARNDIQKSIEYTEKGMKLAEKENDKFSIAVSYNNLGIAYLTKESNDTALLYFEKGIDVAKSINATEVEADLYACIAALYKKQEKYTKAIEYYTKALPLSEKIGDKFGCCVNLINIGVIHFALKNYERAIYYLERAKTLAEELNHSYLKAGVYHALGNLSSNLNENEKALDYLQKSLEMSRIVGDRQYEIISLLSTASTYSDNLDNQDKALEYASEALNIAQKFGVPSIIVGTYVTLSNIYQKQGNYKDCQTAAFNGWQIDSTSLNEASELALNIVISNIHLNNKGKAEYFLRKYIELRNQYAEKNSYEAFADMEVKYETEKKEMRIAVLEKEQELYIGLGIAIAFALLSVIGFLFYRHRSKRRLAEQQIRQLEQEKELIATRSALDAEKAEREIIARDLHDGVGVMLSVVKNNMNIMKSYSVIENKEAEYFNKALDGLDKSIVELRRVAHHIMPAVLVEKGLFVALDDFCRSIPEAEFHYSDTAKRRFDSEKELVLYRCAYELVNNALRHAKASLIEVHLNTDEEMAYLSIVDNGCGFDAQTTHQGMGIKNLHTRLSAFGGRMEIYSEPVKGTEVNVELKIG